MISVVIGQSPGVIRRNREWTQPRQEDQENFLDIPSEGGQADTWS